MNLFFENGVLKLFFEQLLLLVLKSAASDQLFDSKPICILSVMSIVIGRAINLKHLIHSE